MTCLLGFGSPVFGGKAGLSQTIAVNHESGQGSGGVSRDFEFVLQGIDREGIAMWLVARRRADATPTGHAEANARLTGPFGQIGISDGAGATKAVELETLGDHGAGLDVGAAEAKTGRLRKADAAEQGGG